MQWLSGSLREASDHIQPPKPVGTSLVACFETRDSFEVSSSIFISTLCRINSTACNPILIALLSMLKTSALGSINFFTVSCTNFRTLLFINVKLLAHSFNTLPNYTAVLSFSVNKSSIHLFH